MKNCRTDEPVRPLVEDGQKDQRGAFRFIFPQKRRLPLTFKGETVEVLDISAGGLAFKNKGFEQYDSDKVLLDLQMPNYRGDTRLQVMTRILHLAPDGVCHCIFEECTLNEYELLHKYVLEMQKLVLNYKLEP